MACGVSANLLVGGIRSVPAGVPDGGCDDALLGPELDLDAPEAPGREHRKLSVRGALRALYERQALIAKLWRGTGNRLRAGFLNYGRVALRKPDHGGNQ